MRLAIPSETNEGLESVRSGHFGHTPWFTVVTIEDGKITDVNAIKNIDHDTAGCGGVIDYFIGLGLDAILVAGMGRPPFMRFTEAGVQVFFENQTPLVGAVVQKFLDGQVGSMGMGDACNHH